MKQLLFILFLTSSMIFCQENIEAKLIKSNNFNADKIVSVDNFGTVYYLKNNTFLKKSTQEPLTYNNLQLGEVASANAFNPLKINLFYQDFNTAIILDNRLAEIFKIDFNIIQPYKNVTHVSTGFDNTIWLFNQNTQQLELYDYKSNITKAHSLPIQSEILDLKSNYNKVWLLTSNYLYEYNYFGNLVKKTKNKGFSELAENNGKVILKKANKLFLLSNKLGETVPINLPNLLISQFLVTNESLYIYHDQKLHQFHLKTD